MWPLLLCLGALVASGGGMSFTPTTELMSCASQILHFGMEQNSYQIPPTYNRNEPPGKNTTVYIGVNVNRVSGVDENKQEITLDIFLQVSWWEPRLLAPGKGVFMDLPWEYRQLIWMPDLFIYQLQSIKMLSVLQELASLRLYPNGTISVNLGATITITCEMNFVLFPLDIQNCAMDFSSYKYTNRDVKFEWRDVAPWLGVGRTISVQRKEFRLPKYVVTFLTDNQTRLEMFGEGEHSSARLLIKLSRELRGHLLESYLPSALFVILSWGSFCVIPEIVPGRMVLLVTTLLTLVTMIDTVSSNSPDALELKCIEVWLISCTIFVFLALLEYFVVLFGIRYDKSWSKRRVEMRRAASMAQLAPPPLHVNHTQQQRQLGSPGSGQIPSFTAPRNTEDEGLKQQFSHQTITRDSPIPDRLPPIGTGAGNIMARFADSIDRAVMFCGAQHGAIDRYALMVFPVSFTIFVICYWTAYLHAAQYQ